MNAPRQSVGRRGEDQALAYLLTRGYTLLDRNWRTRHGELDIVARDGEWLVFVEVRARISRSAQAEDGGAPHVPMLGAPEESVTPRKRARLAQMAEAYVFDSGWDGPWRIDVVALELDRRGDVVRLNHLRDAIEGLV